MSKKKWLILVVLGAALCSITVVAAVIWLFVIQGGLSMDPFLPVYTTEQVASVHSGYRRTILSSGGAVYVNDYDEYPLRLIDPYPSDIVGRSQFGGGKICAIPGQKPTAYLAADVGSEMPAYEVFRNSQQPPFDWRTTTFQKMQLAMLIGPAANKSTTEPALIEDVVRTLKEGIPTTALAVVATNVHGVNLFCDQLPGLVYCPNVYIDERGAVYLTESIAIEDYKTLRVQARWIPASPLFTNWAQTR